MPTLAALTMSTQVLLDQAVERLRPILPEDWRITGSPAASGALLEWMATNTKHWQVHAIGQAGLRGAVT